MSIEEGVLAVVIFPNGEEAIVRDEAQSYQKFRRFAESFCPRQSVVAVVNSKMAKPTIFTEALWQEAIVRPRDIAQTWNEPHIHLG